MKIFCKIRQDKTAERRSRLRDSSVLFTLAMLQGYTYLKLRQETVRNNDTVRINSNLHFFQDGVGPQEMY